MTSILSIEESIETYVQEHHVEELVQEMLEAIVANRPDNVPRFVVELLIQRYGVQIGKAVVEPSTDFSRTDPGFNFSALHSNEQDEDTGQVSHGSTQQKELQSIAPPSQQAVAATQPKIVPPSRQAVAETIQPSIVPQSQQTVAKTIQPSIVAPSQQTVTTTTEPPIELPSQQAVDEEEWRRALEEERASLLAPVTLAEGQSKQAGGHREVPPTVMSLLSAIQNNVQARAALKILAARKQEFQQS